METLSARGVKNKTDPNTYRVDDCLYIQVRKSGRKYWLFRAVIGGRRRSMSLGPYPLVSYEKAKLHALDNRLALRDGRNPFSDTRRLKPSFRQMAERCHKDNLPKWTEKHAKSWWLELERHGFPKLGDLPVDQITQKDLLGVLKPIWSSKPETGRRVRQRIGAVLGYSQAHGHIRDNVAGPAINGALPSMTNKSENRLALPYHAVPAAVRDIENRIKSLPTKLALHFTILTGVRSQETRFATWSEIDMENAVWEIPKERMKSRRPHRVPLSTGAIAILDRAKELKNPSDLIFPSALKPRQPLSIGTMPKVLKDIGYKGLVTPHGFRASFKTWATEKTKIEREVIESALAHSFGNGAEQAYFRGDLLEKRRSLMQRWDDFIAVCNPETYNRCQ